MRTKTALGLIVAAALPATAFAQAPAPGSATQLRTAKASFVDAANKPMGEAQLTEINGGVLIRIEVMGLPEGEHGFHIHAVGKCDSAGGFESAGPHFSVGEQKHGLMAEGGHHAGEMPNLFVNGTGPFKAHVVNASVTLLDGSSSLFDEDGSALVIHAGPDDYVSQPSGKAGDRIACAVIEKAE